MKRRFAFALALGGIAVLIANAGSARASATQAKPRVPRLAPRRRQHKRVSPHPDEQAPLRRMLAQQQEQLAAQQQQITSLRAALDEQKLLLDRVLASSRTAAPSPPEPVPVASLRPALSSLVTVDMNATAGTALKTSASPSAATASDPEISEKLDRLAKTVDATVANLSGFRFSGDFRLRFDLTARSSNRFAGPYQSARGNYRLRFNVDKAVSDELSFHLQLGSGLANNPLTYNTEFGGFAARGPIFIGEAWADYHPNSRLSVAGGRLPELFADDSRFLFKEDIRFDGFQEKLRVPADSGPLGITAVEFAAGQYILSNPNVTLLPSAESCAPAPVPANCAYLNAGYLPGQKVRNADLFHEGFAVTAGPERGWRHEFSADFQWYRNPNQIALAATAAGAPLVVGSLYGVGSFLPVSGLGTATTTPGGAIFTARRFQIAQLKYRLGYDAWRLKGREVPTYVELHAARNLGSNFLNNAWMGIISAGDATKARGVRLLYAYAAKEGNSMISEVTDDYLGTNTGVNMRTHEFRVDVGLSPALAWQNYLYIQNEISGSDPARHFFVPLPAGTATQYRVQSQLQVTF